ncbi:amidohydrolase family protein, partial [Saccharomonospora saliphila]|uniref:amidohydrolase family protein n=1 Tax=Saccharomonospora saliphila TaxID=369829 RepID=UPI0003715E9A
MTGSNTTLLVGGRIHTPHSPDATALAVTDGTISWIGQDRPARALHPDAETIDLDGAFVAPAFVDAHVHATATGLHLTGVDLSAVSGAGDLLAAVADAARATTPGDVLLAHGWDESTWHNPRLPSRAELDDAVGDVPVYLSRVDVHSALVSTALVTLAPDARAQRGYHDDGPVTRTAHHTLIPALLPLDDADAQARLAWQRGDVTRAGMPARAAVTTAARALRDVVATTMTKGAASEAVTRVLPEGLTRWCR